VWPSKGLNHTGPNPELTWKMFEESFSYTYTIKVIDNNNEVVDYYSRIPRETLSLKVKKILLPGVYNWTVTVVDEFGNQSESGSGSFIVE
jgi:hypothetical protein